MDLVMPQMTGVRTDWDNLNDSDEGNATSVDDCRATCERNSTCRQYSYDQSGVCKTRVNPRLGISAEGVTSGWLEDRVAAFANEMPPCEKASIISQGHGEDEDADAKADQKAMLSSSSPHPSPCQVLRSNRELSVKSSEKAWARTFCVCFPCHVGQTQFSLKHA
jgi:hypothetical protein